MLITGVEQRAALLLSTLEDCPQHRLYMDYRRSHAAHIYSTEFQADIIRCCYPDYRCRVLSDLSILDDCKSKGGCFSVRKSIWSEERARMNCIRDLMSVMVVFLRY